MDLLKRISEDDEAVLFSDFCNGIGESYSGVEVLNIVDFADDQSGTIEVDVTGHVHMGCRDINGPEDHSVTVDFHIDIENETITFSTTSPVENNRYPNDEL